MSKEQTDKNAVSKEQTFAMLLVGKLSKDELDEFLRMHDDGSLDHIVYEYLHPINSKRKGE